MVGKDKNTKGGALRVDVGRLSYKLRNFATVDSR